MNRAERDTAVEEVARVLTGLWLEHAAACSQDPCPAKDEMEGALQALYSLRKSR